MSAALIVLLVVALFVLFVLARTIRIIPQARAGVVERLGRYSRTLTPGLSIVVPFVDRNPSTKPGDRKLAVTLFTMLFMFGAVLTIIGCFFRGPGFNWVWPWKQGLFFEL